MFSDPYGGLVEDPVTGSLNASLALWLREAGRATGEYVASQGTKLGRTGRVYVKRDGDGVTWIGGSTKSLFHGKAAF